MNVSIKRGAMTTTFTGCSAVTIRKDSQEVFDVGNLDAVMVASALARKDLTLEVIVDGGQLLVKRKAD